MEKPADLLNFCQDIPSEDFYHTIEGINQLNSQQNGELFEIVFVLINNPDIIGEIDVLLSTCSEKTGVNVTSIKDFLRVLLIISKEAKRNKLTPGQVYSDLLKLKMNSVHATSFCKLWKQNILLPKESIDFIATKRLLDIDWKFGVTASSDTLARVGNCYLQLKMVVAKGIGTENILMEMTIPQFYEFLHELEKAKLKLDLEA